MNNTEKEMLSETNSSEYVVVCELTKRKKRYLPVKRALDIILAGCVSIVLSPVMGVLAIAIKVDSPGPVLFKQKRVGKDKQMLEIWKFRTMYTDTPKDIPTHMLDEPDAYITRTGRIMRRYSLDELPQLWQCVLGVLSLIGPRPALWNQDDLIAERDKYGANNIKPGITGWAQINGRDELEIPVKARFDGEYVEKLGFKMDVKCFLGTIGSVLRHDGVVEGKNKYAKVANEGRLRKEIRTGGVIVTGVTGFACLALLKKNFRWKKSCQNKLIIRALIFMVMTGEGLAALYLNIKKRIQLTDSFLKEDIPDLEKYKACETNPAKRILITGAGSYIGESVEKLLLKNPEQYQVEALDLLDEKWSEKDFSGFDVVFHVAGIAHADVQAVSEEQKKTYYKINTELAVEVAEIAKDASVKQFIFMSSMIIYSGCKEKYITKDTKPNPKNFYGDSKWQAEQKIKSLADETFKVVVLRPPMVYGKGSRGNYQELARFAVKFPIFPYVKNRRSMLHIDNLCELVKLVIDNNESGVFFPQNGEYTSTSDMALMIAQANEHQIILLPGVNIFIKLLKKMPGAVGGLSEKAFGDFAYEMSISEYKKDYRVRTLLESVRLTEGERM